MAVTMRGGPRKNVLIINLTRLGDLLQMTPFLSGFRREHGDAKITLLVLKGFYDICRGFSFVDEVETFDGEDFLSRLEDPDRSLIENFRILEGLVERLKCRKFDMVINLTFSRLSALLTSLLKAQDVRGITIDDHGSRLVKNPWINHFYNIVTKREINLFNYVDFIRKAGGAEGRSAMTLEVAETDRRFARAFYRDHGVADSDFVVGFQPGASRDSRRWPTGSFGRLAARLVLEGCKVLLLGSSAERELGQRIRESLVSCIDQGKSHLLDAMGKTSVNQLAALLERCDLLVTGDTGTMHVATAVGTRVVGLFFGPAYFPETGPYGEGHMVIQTEMPCSPCEHNIRCKNPKCRDSIRVSHVFRVIQMLREGLFTNGKQLADGPAWEGIQIYRGDFDEDDMLEFRPIIRRPLGRTELVRQTYREMWKIVLNGHHREIDPGRIVEKLRHLFVVGPIVPDVGKDCEAFARLVELARQGIEISKKLIQWSQNMERNIVAIKTAGQVIHDIDERIELCGKTHAACHPLAYMFRQGKENIEEGGISVLSQKTLHLYETLSREATLMKRGLAETASLLERAH